MNGERCLTAEADQLLEEGVPVAEIRRRGYSDSLIRQRIKRRQKRLGVQEGADGAPTVRKSTEVVLPEFLLPTIGELFDGDERIRRAYIAGIGTVLLGMRLFCEGFAPFLQFQRVLQESQIELTAATLSHSEKVAEALGSSLKPALGELKQALIASAPNPLQSMLTNLLSPYLQRFLNRIMNAAAPQGGAMDSTNFTFQVKKRRERDGQNG